MAEVERKPPASMHIADKTSSALWIGYQLLKNGSVVVQMWVHYLISHIVLCKFWIARILELLLACNYQIYSAVINRRLI